MKRHVYYRIELMLAAPLSIGNGKNEGTDHDVIRGKDGKPYIPASSIAGVFRHTLDSDTELQNKMFGNISGNNAKSSKVIFYDGLLTTKEFSTTRDSVKLENKVGVNGAKFDMEVIETGARFITFIEIADQPDETDNAVDKMIARVKSGILRFGTKTSRGYGRVEISSLKKRVFNLENESEMNDWLDFNTFDEKCWNHLNEYAVADNHEGYIRITLHMIQSGAVSIREYSTDVGKDGSRLPDYKHIALHDGTSIIPGTSWSGAFRARFLEFAGEETTNHLFGYLDKENKDNLTEKSRIIFSESVISHNCIKEMTRNSIDRFSAATKDTALYTERTSYNGETTLDILLKDDVSAEEKAILSAVILDIHYGFLAIGGLTAVGRGMFKIKSIMVNGKENIGLLKPETVSQLLEVEA